MNSVPQIFKERLINSRLDHFKKESVPDFDAKFKEIGLWCNAVEEKHLDRTKETAVQGAFMTRLFNQVFGYMEVVDGVNCYNQERENKTVLDTTESDGALGFFYKDTGKKDVRVVIELKDARTPLDKKQNRSSHLTPVEQAFSYANKNGSKCTWVIVSNFVETRLYRSTSSLEYETFDMRMMREEAQFLRFYYFLCKDHLIAEEGKSVIDSLYQENEAEGVDISNKFYSTYKEIRNNLFNSLKENNPERDELLLFTKTQKLMDRFTFICFCEDCDLLPQNIFSRLIETAKQSFSFAPNKLWEQLRGLFASIDHGNPPMKINRYNGGLFKEDPELDSLIIPDDVLETFVQLSSYDFNSDLNVNILGQIFEQSISDVEQIKNEINGVESENVGKQKQDGIYYTPYYVTRYIVENTVGKYLSEKKEALKREIFSPKGEITVSVIRPSTGRSNDRKFTHWVDIPENKENMSEDEIMDRKAVEGLHLIYWNAYEKVLKEIKICDPACGSGAFLNQCFDYLHEEMDFLLDMKQQFDPQYSVFDIDKQILQNNLYGVDINSESVEITKLSLWLKTAKNNQTLATLDENIKCGNSIIDDSAIVDNPFKWDEEFQDVIATGGFDVVIGNPPYGASLSQDEKKYIAEKYMTTEYNYDTYKTFMELGMAILKQDGYLGYITPSTYFVLEKGATKLRKMLFEEYTLTNVVELFNVFDSAIVEPAISVFKKRKPQPTEIFETISVPRKTSLSSTFINDGISSSFTHQELLEGENYTFNYHATEQEKALEKKIISMSQSMGNIFQITTGVKPYQTGKGVPKQTKEIVETKPFNAATKINETYIPYMKSGDVRAFTNSWRDEYISYGKWLAESNDEVIYQKEKLLVRQTGDYPIASYFNDLRMGNNSLHFVYYKDNKSVDLKYALGFFNSKLIKWLYQYDYFHMVGKPLACVKKVFLDRLPIKIDKDQQPLIEIVEKLLELSQTRFDLSKRFAKYIEATYNPKKISEKILYSYENDYKTLLDELKKQSVKLSAKEQMSLMELFDDNSSKLKDISAQIDRLMFELNDYIYKLYNLSEEEIGIIESRA